MKRSFTLTRVVTRDIITDWFQSLRNLFGLRLRAYEDRIQKNMDEMLEIMSQKYPKVSWFRVSINPLTKASIMIIVYGETS